MLNRPTKLPLEASFAWLCGFIGTLHNGLVLISKNKHDVNAAVSFTIPASGWKTGGSAPDYQNYIDITVPGLLDTDIVAVYVAPESVSVARTANFATTQSFDGKFRLRAENIPSEAISAQYHITNTSAYKIGGGGDEVKGE